MLTPTLARMRTRAPGVTCVVAVFLLGGCASSPGVRQAKQTDPIIVVAVQSTPAKKAPVKQAPRKAERIEKARDEAAIVGILGVLGGPDDLGGLVGGVPGGVVGGILGGAPPGGGGFGGLGLSGVGIVGSGHGLGTIRVGSDYEGLSRSGANERPRVKIGAVMVSGPLMVDVVQRHVDLHRDDLQTCHSLEYKESGNRWGSVTLRLHIVASGRVDDVQVHDTTLSSRDLESCLAHAAGAFEFPSPGTNASVTVLLPITF